MNKKSKNWENGVVEVDKALIEKGLKDFVDRFNFKRKQKGCKSFNSLTEGMGKIFEEFTELQIEQHNRDITKFRSEALDVSISALWAYISTFAWFDKGKKK